MRSLRRDDVEEASPPRWRERLERADRERSRTPYRSSGAIPKPVSQGIESSLQGSRRIPRGFRIFPTERIATASVRIAQGNRDLSSCARDEQGHGLAVVAGEAPQSVRQQATQRMQAVTVFKVARAA